MFKGKGTKTKTLFLYTLMRLDPSRSQLAYVSALYHYATAPKDNELCSIFNVFIAKVFWNPDIQGIRDQGIKNGDRVLGIGDGDRGSNILGDRGDQVPPSQL